MLLSQKIGGEGISLVGASRLVVFEPDHNPAKDEQLNGRLWRQGQTAKAVYTYRLLCAGTLEEVIYQRQQAKLDLGGSIRDGELSASDAASMLGENARLLSAERGSWSTLFKGLEPQCLSAPRELGLHLETASHEGSVSHIHIKRRTSA